MDVVTKSVEAAVAPVESEHPNGEFEVILSTETLDRDDENLWAQEWKQPLPARIHIDGDHGRTLEKTVGSAVPRIEGNQMIGKGTYAGTEYAQMVRQLVNEGHINSVSVTYAERKNAKGEGTVERELLNAAFVAIPANPEAVVLASKAAKIEGAGKQAGMDFAQAFKAEGGVDASGDNPQVKHDDMVQAIHDAAIHLGAQCMNEIEADPGEADGANKGIEGTTGTVLDGLVDRRLAKVKLIQSGLITDKDLKEFDLPKSSSPEAGSPQESPDDSPAKVATKAAAIAPAEVPTKAADDSAEETATKANAAAKARALAFLINKNTA